MRSRAILPSLLLLTFVLVSAALPASAHDGPQGFLRRVPHRPPSVTHVDSRLLRPAPQRAGAAGLVNVLVVVDGPQRLEGLRTAIAAAGGRVVEARGRLAVAEVPRRSLIPLAAVPGVQRIRPAAMDAVPAQLVSQGVPMVGADLWQQFGLTGSGVKVGIIEPGSVSGFAQIDRLLGTELPTTTQFRCYTAPATVSSDPAVCAQSSESHGTSVAETVADVAPGAQLFLANPITILDTLTTIDWMAANGVRIINASYGATGFEGPGDGTSPYPDSDYAPVEYAAQRGILWVNSAGNAGDATWSGPFVEDPVATGWLDFAPSFSGNRVTLTAGQEVFVALRWSDSWLAPQADYGLYLFPAGGTESIAGADETQEPGVPPTEFLDFTAPASGTYEIAVYHNGGPTPPLQMVVTGLVGNQALQFRTATPSLLPPTDSANPAELTVGAVRFDRPTVLESYSSTGPTADGRIKPDLVAPDCATTTLETTFCGTSQAAPYAAGVAALLMEAFPGPLSTPTALASAMRGLALPLGFPNPRSGYGRVWLGPPPPASPDQLQLTLSPNPVAPGAIAQLSITLRTPDGSPAPDGTVLAASVGGGGAVVGTDGLGATTTAGGSATLTYVAPAESELVPLVVTVPAWGLSRTILAQVGTGVAPPAPAAPPTPSTIWGVAGRSMGITSAGWAPGAAVTLQYSPDLRTWYASTVADADPTGTASFAAAFLHNGWIRGWAPGAGPSLPAQLLVRQTVAVRPTGATPRWVPRGATLTFTATVRPVPAGTVTFTVYHAVGGRWVAYARRTARADASGVARLPWRFTVAGSWLLQAVANATSTNAASAAGQSQLIRVP
jgi:hypothetical protein